MLNISIYEVEGGTLWHPLNDAAVMVGSANGEKVVLLKDLEQLFAQLDAFFAHAKQAHSLPDICCPTVEGVD